MGNIPRNHRIIVCTMCRHTGGKCDPGLKLIQKLNAAIASAGAHLSEIFEISGTACLSGCSRPCTVAFSASQKTTYLFGDIQSADDVSALTSFANMYVRSEDGMSKSAERPLQLMGKTMARIPSVFLVTEAQEGELQ